MKIFYIVLIIACVYVLFEFRHLYNLIDELKDAPSKWLVVSLEEDLKSIRVLCTNCGYLTEVLTAKKDSGKYIIKAKDTCPCCKKRMSDKLLEVHENITM